MTQTPKVEKQDNEMVAGWLPSVPLGAPKVEKRDIAREELKDLFQNFDGDKRAEFIEKYPDIWDYCTDIFEGSSSHRVMVNSVLAGYDFNKSKIEALETALKAANKFIEISPGDPDVFDDQYKAYKDYQDALAKVDV